MFAPGMGDDGNVAGHYDLDSANTSLSPQSRTLAFCLHGASESDQDLCVMINAYWEDLTFTLQESVPHDWKRVVDTSLSFPDDFSDPPLPARLLIPLRLGRLW